MNHSSELTINIENNPVSSREQKRRRQADQHVGNNQLDFLLGAKPEEERGHVRTTSATTFCLLNLIAGRGSLFEEMILRPRQLTPSNDTVVQHFRP